MNTAFFGFEFNGMQNDQCQAKFGPLPGPFTVIGYQISTNFGALDWPSVIGIEGQSTYAVAAMYAWLTASDPGPNWVGGQNVGGASQAQISGTNEPPAFAGVPIQIGLAGLPLPLFIAGSTVWEPGEHDNQAWVMPPGSLSIPVPPQSWLIWQAAHSGAKANLSASGVLFYA